MSSRPGALVLLGHPVSHSLSPAMQNAALRAAGIPLEYVAADVPPDRLPDALLAVRQGRGAGNVTVPHKVGVHGFCDDLTEAAQRVGAVNAFKVDDDQKLIGHNTDVGGIDVALHALLPEPSGIVVALLGAGGAAAGALVATDVYSVETRIWSRAPERARAMARRSPTAKAVESLDEAVAYADIVVNATSVGMADDGMPCPIEFLTPGTAVLDLVYRPDETRWVREARAAGYDATDGLGVLLEQGALSFEWWLGVEPDREAMRAALPPR